MFMVERILNPYFTPLNKIEGTKINLEFYNGNVCEFKRGKKLRGQNMIRFRCEGQKIKGAKIRGRRNLTRTICTYQPLGDDCAV